MQGYEWQYFDTSVGYEKMITKVILKNFLAVDRHF